MLLRRLRQTRAEGELSLPEISALAHLDRGGPSTSGALAQVEQISAQSMGATLASLERRGLVRRTADPEDGRRALISVSDTGLQLLRDRRNDRVEMLARALAGEFSAAELRQLERIAPLLERLAQSI